jgi:hypothetical protein
MEPTLKRTKVLILIRNSHESVRDCDVRDVPDIMECGGKRSATPLCRKSRPVVRQNQRSPRGPKRRRRCALPAHSIGSGHFRSTLDTSWCESCIKMRAEARAPERGIHAAPAQDKRHDAVFL